MSKIESWGRMVESAVGCHLLNTSITQGFELSYWRESNDEVDFIIAYKGKIVALEVKSSFVRNKNHGMIAFKKKFKNKKSYIIGNTGIDIEEFLKMNVLDLF